MEQSGGAVRFCVQYFVRQTRSGVGSMTTRLNTPLFRSPELINDLWYKNAIVYCLSVSTYMDADGDGVGDFKGLMRRLDYLQGFGVTAIWLMPFQPSSRRNAAYDIADYYGVHPKY